MAVARFIIWCEREGEKRSDVLSLVASQKPSCASNLSSSPNPRKMSNDKGNFSVADLTAGKFPLSLSLSLRFLNPSSLSYLLSLAFVS